MAIGTQADVAHKAWWQTFEVVFGIPFASAVALQLVAPLSVPPRFLTIVVVPAGIALVVGGVAFVVFAPP